MLRLIEKRYAKFTSAINAFLNDCAEKNVDAVERIKSDKDNFIPVPSESRGDTPGPTTA